MGVGGTTQFAEVPPLHRHEEVMNKTLFAFVWKQYLKRRFFSPSTYGGGDHLGSPKHKRNVNMFLTSQAPNDDLWWMTKRKLFVVVVGFFSLLHSTALFLLKFKATQRFFMRCIAKGSSTQMLE